jgi:hypothetical protein
VRKKRLPVPEVKKSRSAALNRLHGILKRKPGEPSFAHEWREHKRQELGLEQRKYDRSTRSS